MERKHRCKSKMACSRHPLVKSFTQVAIERSPATYQRVMAKQNLGSTVAEMRVVRADFGAPRDRTIGRALSASHPVRTGTSNQVSHMAWLQVLNPTPSSSLPPSAVPGS